MKHETLELALKSRVTERVDRVDREKGMFR